MSYHIIPYTRSRLRTVRNLVHKLRSHSEDSRLHSAIKWLDHTIENDSDINMSNVSYVSATLDSVGRVLIEYENKYWVRS